MRAYFRTGQCREDGMYGILLPILCKENLFQTYLEAAKTKLTKNYNGIHPTKITTTVGLNIGKIDLAGIRLNFWDLGGQNELQSLWDKVCYNSLTNSIC